MNGKETGPAPSDSGLARRLRRMRAFAVYQSLRYAGILATLFAAMHFDWNKNVRSMPSTSSGGRKTTTIGIRATC